MTGKKYQRQRPADQKIDKHFLACDFLCIVLWWADGNWIGRFDLDSNGKYVMEMFMIRMDMV